jgi:hypothetical protein
MGYGGWSQDAYTNLTSSKSYATKTIQQIFSSSLQDDMNPKGIKIRESRDSDEHPKSIAVMVFLDVTGSMGRIPQAIAQEKLGALMSTIIDNGVPDPQVFFGAIGDHHTDHVPLQVGQFESEATKLDYWLTRMYPEGNGGGQVKESYLLAWIIAGRHTSIDCFEKRGEKGFLFTIGDEASWDGLDTRTLKDLLGYTEAQEVTDVQLLEEAQRLYNVYHIHINEGSYENYPPVLEYWKKMLGERFLVLDDYNAVCETIATLIAVQHGVDMKSVTSKFSANIAGAVSTALVAVSAAGNLVAANNDGVIKL